MNVYILESCPKAVHPPWPQPGLAITSPYKMAKWTRSLSPRQTVFIACQHTDVQYRYSNCVCLSIVRPSVHLSVCDAPGSDENGLIYCHSFYRASAY